MNLEVSASSQSLQTQAGQLEESQATVQPSEKQTIMVLFAILESLSFEMCSPDLWWLAMHRAKSIAINQFGLSEEMFLNIVERFEKARKNKNKENPMASIF